MSYDPNEAEYEQFVDRLYKEFHDSAVHDFELYDSIIDDFKESRLRDFYLDHPLILQSAKDALTEAHALVTDYPRPALLLAVTACEVCLRYALLTPILHGSFHTESSAELVVKLIVEVKVDPIVKALLQILADHTGFDLRNFLRPGSRKPLWEEMRELQHKRNQILHQAESAVTDDARHAVEIADALVCDLFQRAIAKLGLHLHDGVRLCGIENCPPT